MYTGGAEEEQDYLSEEEECSLVLCLEYFEAADWRAALGPESRLDQLLGDRNMLTEIQ